MPNFQFTQPLPLSLYVHYPWCIQKCPYCDFNSHTLKADEEVRYLKAMIRQLEQTLPQVWGRPIQTIFFGGGTPSLISEAGLADFLTEVKMLLGIRSEIEITLEANPGTVDFTKFRGFRQAGINRLSMGIQSFENDKLQALGRIHSAEEAKKAIESAKQAGFENFNLDLMFALPNQSIEQAVQDVQTALSFAPPHLSHYQLTLEPNTPFYKHPPPLPEEEAMWEMQSACQAVLAEAGYVHYEVSAYAQPNRACRHNLNYWQFGDYIGLGAGAHGKLTLPALDATDSRILRTQMPASPGGYVAMIDQGGTGRQIEVLASEVVFEFMLNVLRLRQPFEVKLFEQRTGLPISVIVPKLLQLEEKGFISSMPVSDLSAPSVTTATSTEAWQLTDLGHNFLNDVIAHFL